MTYLHSLSVEPPLTVEAVLRPVIVVAENPGFDQFIAAPAEAGVLSLQSTPTVVLAQFEDIDILADMVNLWNTFIESGQVWALIIGLVVGYFLRGLTTYS
jgi:hypothetical protein